MSAFGCAAEPAAVKATGAVFKITVVLNPGSLWIQGHFGSRVTPSMVICGSRRGICHICIADYVVPCAGVASVIFV